MDLDWKKALDKLISLGYLISISGNDLSLKWQGRGDPPKDEVLPPIQIIKLHKNEILNDSNFILLNTPIRELKKSLAVHSQILDEVIYLVPSEEMARQVEDEGKVAYLPEEIAALSRKSKAMDQDEWIDFLKKMHMVKKIFMGSRIQA